MQEGLEDFNNLFYYDESSPSCLRRKTDWVSGEYYNIVKAHTGDAVGGLTRSGYYRLNVNGRNFLCHRIIWEIHFGKVESGTVLDHVNGVRSDNRIANLRCIDNKVNCRNGGMRSTNKSTATGVSFRCHETTSRWVAQYMTLCGKVRSRSFAVNKYGNEGAFRLACEYRARMITELNLQGAGYTETHGIRNSHQ